MENKDEIEKLLSLEIEKKVKERSFSGVTISYDELISMVSASSGKSEELLREAVRVYSIQLAILYKEDKAKFKEVLKDFCGGYEIDIVEDDT